MNTPQPTPVPSGKKPLVVPSMSRRELVLAICIIVALVGFICLAVFTIGQRPKNNLSGVIKGRYSTGERETLLDVRRSGVSRSTADTGYYLKVYVEDDKQTYNVMVEKELWEKKKDGERLEFLKPVSQQR